MNDYIDRQAAIDAIEEYADRLQMVDWKENPGVPYKAYALNWCINTIRDLPSAQPEQQIPQMRGWVCPVCGRGLSPYTSVCPCNNGKGWEITC